MKTQSKAYVFALAAVLLWSTVASAFKIALQFVDVFSLLFFSSLTATIFMIIVMMISGKWDVLVKLKPNIFFQAAIRGFLNPFLYYLILFKAYNVLPAQEAMSLNYIWPIMLVLLSIVFLNQKVGIKSFVGMLVSFIGVMTIATHGQLNTLKFENPEGAALALFSSVVWALFWLVNLKNKEDETVKLFLSFSFGTLFSFIAVSFFGQWPVLSFKSGFSLIYIGLAEMGVTFFLWSKAMKLSLRTDQVSRLIFLSPFLSLFLISMVLGEKIGQYTIVGLLLIIAGILLGKNRSRTKEATSG
ncbi:MAG: EamA family transporter [Bacteroidales bacterium]|nr:EamA family transporter [Bacteroidales bacterium]